MGKKGNREEGGEGGGEQAAISQPTTERDCTAGRG